MPDSSSSSDHTLPDCSVTDSASVSNSTVCATSVSATDFVRDLHARFPQAPFLTLGQTVLWDEPVKAVFCRLLEVAAPEARMMAAVHDTDYFAKLPQNEGAPKDDEPNTTDKFALLPHNDGSTRALWSAAGEISCLFGAEVVPSRHVLSENGVAFDRVARDYPGGLNALLENETAAWGWRALVHTEPRPLIAGDVKLRDIMPQLQQQIAWALDKSAQIIGHENSFSQLLDWTNEYSSSHPDASLSDLYRALTPKLWSAVRGGGSCNLETSTSLELFRFNKRTASLPRFRFVDLFLNPQTRDVARTCYNDAVRGSGIYTLDGFGEGATPFDVVVPGRGRGTLRVHNGSITVETETPITICTDCNPTSAEDLARVLEEQLGENVALVGKAVALISMLAAEFIFVFHEKASSYTSRTQEMNKCLRERGVDLPLFPMLRLRLATWDALQNVEANFNLPPHLARAFDVQKISAREFAARWKTVCNEQDNLRERLKNCVAPRDLMQFLATRDQSWTQKLHEYSMSREQLHSARESSQKLQLQSEELLLRARELNVQAAHTETVQGEHWRRVIQPLRTRIMDIRQGALERIENAPAKLSKEERRELSELQAKEEEEIAQLLVQIETKTVQRIEYSKQIESLRKQSRECKSAARDATQNRLLLERSEQTRALRTAIREVEYQEELTRLSLVRDAIAVGDGLRATNYRPTAWWFPLVSPEGAWFEGLVETVQARVEEL